MRRLAACVGDTQRPSPGGSGRRSGTSGPWLAPAYVFAASIAALVVPRGRDRGPSGLGTYRKAKSLFRPGPAAARSRWRLRAAMAAIQRLAAACHSRAQQGPARRSTAGHAAQDGEGVVSGVPSREDLGTRLGVRIHTSSRKPALRLLCMGVALVLRNIWVWLHAEVMAQPWHGARQLQPQALRFARLML